MGNTNTSFPGYEGASNLPEIINLSGIPRFANKKSGILRIFGKSFISGIPGSLNYPRNPGIQTNLGKSGFYLQKHSPRETFPRNFFPENIKCLGEAIIGQKLLFAKGFASGNLPGIIDLSGFLRFANKKSRISGIFKKILHSGISGAWKSFRNH